MVAAEFELRLMEWARRQDGLEALVLGGSRAHPNGAADLWSDWDIHLITTRPQDYADTAWLGEIATCWCANSEMTPRGVVKVSAVFAGGFEVDFVPLAAWQMKLVYAAMKYPIWSGWMPRRLRQGISETRAFMLGSGHRLLVGNESWARRLFALEVPWPIPELSEEEFLRHVAGFWTKAVWVSKKIARPEPRSAMHWLHMLMVQHVYAFLAEEARLEGRESRPEARKAEKWLAARRLDQTAITTSLEQCQLAEALLAEMALFNEITKSIGVRRGFTVASYAEVEAWLQTELAKVAS